MTDPQATFKSTLWNHAGKILEYVLMYCTSVLIARGLGVQENGTFVGLFSVSQLFLVLTSFGLEVSLNKHIPQLADTAKSEHIRYILIRALVLRVIVVLCVAGALYTLLHLLTGVLPAKFPEYIWLVLGYAGVRSVVSLFAIVLTAELQTHVTSAINVLTRLLEVILIGLLMSAGMTSISVFTIFLSTATLQTAAYVVAARGYLFGKQEPHAVLPLVMFGSIYWANTVVEYFLGRHGDVLLLTILLPDSAQVSLYDVAFAVSQLASLSMTIGLGGITLATSARLALQGSEVLERFYGFLIRLTSLLSLPLYAFILFNASSVLLVMYSSRYLAASGFIQGIAAFRIAGRLFGGPENAEFLLARSAVSKLVGIGIMGAIVNVGLDLVLIPSLGATGAVIGSGIGNLTVNMLGAIAVYKSSSERIQWQFWLKIASVTCAASFVCSIVIPPTNLLLVCMQVVMYALVILFSFALIKPLTSPDREWLSRIDSRFAAPLRYFSRRDSTILPVTPT